MWRERTNAGQSLRQGKAENSAGGRACYRKQLSSFHIFFFILSEEVASSKSQTGFLSLPVVSNNGSILYLALCAVKIQPLSCMVSDRGFLQVHSISFIQWISHNQTCCTIMQQETGTLLKKLKVPLHRIWGQKMSSYNDKSTCNTSSQWCVPLTWSHNDGNFLPEKKLIKKRPLCTNTKHSDK